jgi:HlyD family secretion protein
MRPQCNLRQSKWKAVSVVVLTAICTVALIGAVAARQSTRPPSEKYDLVNVRRMDLFPALSASGRVESSQRTVIECELEAISIGIMGQRLIAGGASVLLSLIPDGSIVHKGDILAVLDASDYEELLRQQKMTVERARADFNQAQLDYEIAKLAVREFQEGLMQETMKDFDRTVAMSRSDLVRCKDRVEWAQRMKKKGYIAASVLSNEELNHARALFAYGQEKAAYDLYIRWTVPKALKELNGKVLGAEAILNYQKARLARNLDRLAKLQKQVELCTIRAPHDGFVIYANDDRRSLQIVEGMSVYQKQDLFYLPDLTNMEVVTSLHESIVREIAKGMPAKVWVEGLPNRRLEGHVTEIAAIPTFNWRSDVRYFDGKVKLDHPPRGILPGMTAHVEISLKRKDQVLAVPAEAVAFEDGREVCYVAHEDGLERREVTLGEGTEDLLEICKGLHEGEQVVLNPNVSEVQHDTSTLAVPISETTFSEDASPASEPVRQIAAMR